ncbi:MAG TPA: hypothetical protein VFC31_07065 [Candidatus Limnocylindria bacterium]|nr:hypothetical protein [Candidatus Limnocylindria bacterium]
MARTMDERELEAVLGDIGARLAYPRPTRMADAVRARLREPRPRRRWIARLVPALVTVALLVLVVALASPGVRAAANELLRLRGIDIFPVPSVPAPTTPPPSASPAGRFPGTHVTLADARGRVSFPIRVPADLGEPDEVYVERVGTSDHVTLVYLAAPGRPAPSAAMPDVAAVVVELRGGFDEAFLGKGVGPGTRVEPVTVNGAAGSWIEGQPHFFFYRDAQGGIQQETLRLAGNTLIWIEGDVTLRLEAQVSKDVAIGIATRFR